MAAAALALGGYKAERANHHLRLIQSLAFTLGTDTTTLRKFDVFRKKRNITDYERADTISDAEVVEMQRLAASLRAALRNAMKSRE